MLSTISILSMLLVGCGNSEKKEEAPAKTEQQIKDEAKEAAKKELEAEAKKKEEETKKAEEEKAALKEEIKEEIKEEAAKKEEEEAAKKEEEEAAKKEEEAKKAPAKPAKPAEKTFNTRVSVDELPLKGRKARFEAAAKSTLSKIAGKAGYKNMKGSLSFQGQKPSCKGGKCIWKVEATFTK